MILVTLFSSLRLWRLRCILLLGFLISIEIDEYRGFKMVDQDSATEVLGYNRTLHGSALAWWMLFNEQALLDSEAVLHEPSLGLWDIFLF